MPDQPSRLIILPDEFVAAAAAGIREPTGQGWMNPGRPMTGVILPEPPERKFDFQYGHNYRWQPKLGEGISFQALRTFARVYDLLRLAIETRKDQIEGMDWEIVPHDPKLRHENGWQDDAATVTAFLEQPSTEYDWGEWLRAILEDHFVCDGICIAPRRTRAGDLYSLDPVDPTTIKKVIDDRGFTPMPPDLAYQQIIKGIPSSDFTTDELWYWMRNPSTDRIYGLSIVEWIVMTVQIALNRQASTLAHYTDGNMPDSLLGLPDSWTIEHVRAFQTYWDDLLAGRHDQRRKMKFVPFDPQRMKEIKSPDLKNEFDEWLARLVCFAFSISPTMLVRDVNRATAETNQVQANSEGNRPLLKWLKRKIDYVIRHVAGYGHLQFRWKEATSVRPKEQAEIDVMMVKEKIFTPDEIREQRGARPMTAQERAEAFPAPPPMFGPAENPADAEKLAKRLELTVNVEAPHVTLPAPQVFIK